MPKWMPTKIEFPVGHRSLLPSLTVIAALLVCKGLLYGTALLAVIGVVIDIPPGPWAVAVDIAVLGATVAFWLNRRRHGMVWPTILAALGAILVIGRMHAQVPEALEWTGFGLLVVAAVFDWRAGRSPAGHRASPQWRRK